MSNLPANISNLVANLQAAKDSGPADAGDFLYLKLAKTGLWIYGSDEIEVDDESLFIIDPATYTQGYIAWDNGKLAGEKMAMQGQPQINERDLPELPAPTGPDRVEWAAQKAFALIGKTGPEKGQQFLYKSSSKGGKKAIAKLLTEIITQIKSGDPDYCPIVRLENDSYKHPNKAYGRIQVPILTVVGWTTPPEVGSVAAGIDEDDDYDDDDSYGDDGYEEEETPVVEPEPEPAPVKKVRRARRKKPAE